MTYLNNKNKKLISYMDTIKMIEDDIFLKEEVKKSITEVYVGNEDFSQNLEKSYETVVEVTNFDTISEALKYRNENLCILVFSSNKIDYIYKKRGIGNNQESEILRSTTLSKLLDTTYCIRNFYKNNQLHSKYYGTDKVLYISNGIIFKQNDKLLLRTNWLKADFIFAVAPDLSNNDIPNDKLYEIYLKRIKNIFDSAIKNKKDVLILGAIGCGENCNSPNIVAKAFSRMIEIYDGIFKKIIFAIKCNDLGKVNYNTFKKVLTDCKNNKNIDNNE